jgi:hypothetical protein
MLVVVELELLHKEHPLVLVVMVVVALEVAQALLELLAL